MKNFSDLLATDLMLEVVVNNNWYLTGLQDPMQFQVKDSVTVDGIEVLPKYKHLAQDGWLKINEPFYCWYHGISGQGWLLTPQ